MLSGVLALSLVSGARGASVGLGTASDFAVLGGSTVTNTGPSVIGGDVGLAPGSAVTGFGPATVTGTTHVNDTVAIGAKSDLVTAYNDAASRPSTATVSGDLVGLTLVGGVYTSTSTLGLSGELVLDGQNDPNSVFVFQVGTGLTVGSGSRVRLINGAQSCNVFWQVGSSATIGTGAVFVGNIFALSSITVTTGVTLDGRALARNGAVTLDTDTITRSTCATPDAPPAGPVDGGTIPPDAGSPAPDAPPAGPTTFSDGTTAFAGVPGVGTSAPADTAASSGAAPASAVTLPAVSVGSTTGVVAGTVRSPTGPATYVFQYGMTKKYGRQTVPGTSGSSKRRIKRTLRGLKQGRLHHYRVVVTGPKGSKTYGKDRTFRTRTPARLARRPWGFAG